MSWKEINEGKQIVKKLFENWRHYLQESPDGKGPLGFYAFPGNKKQSDPNDKNEPDTKIEKKLAEFLGNHFQYSTRPLPQQATQIIVKMIQDGNYPEIFKFYKSGLVYRGITVPKEFYIKNYGELPEARKWYKAPIDWFMGRTKKTGGIKFPFSPTSKPGYSPSLDDYAGSLASSWSTSLGEAQSFSMNQDNKEDISIVIVADSSKNMFIDTKPFSEKYDFVGDFENEEEVIGVGDITLTHLYVLDEVQE